MQKVTKLHHAEIRTSTSLQLFCRSGRQCHALLQLSNYYSCCNGHSSLAFPPQLLLLSQQAPHRLSEV